MSKTILKALGFFMVIAVTAAVLTIFESGTKPVSADSWITAKTDPTALSNYKQERNERIIQRDFPKPSTWKIILRERLSRDEVYYLLENKVGKRFDFKPCGMGTNYIIGETVKVTQKASIGADDDFECSLDIYKE